MILYYTFASFIVFNFFALYSANSFNVTFKNFFFKFIPISFLDGLLFFSYFFFFNYDYEIFALFCVFFVYLFQFMLFIEEKTKYKYAVCVYYTLATLIPFYAMRLFLLGYFALQEGVSIPDFLENPFERSMLLTCSLLVASLTKIFYFSKFCVKKIASVMHDYKNLAFLTRVLVAIYIHALFMSYYVFRINDKTTNLDYFVMKVGVCYIFGYFIMLLYAIIFDLLKNYQQKLQFIQKTIQDEQVEIEKLKQESVTDPTTGLKVRSVALEVIEEYIEQKEAFYVIFVDMDGLKYTNDVYGHEEGDFYIKSTANLLKEFFLSDTVVRFGGDEFLIVGEAEENISHMSNQIALCREKAVLLSKENNKVYSTSFSYGLIEVEANTKLTVEEILDIADSRMYEHKKRMKKTRQVIDISLNKLAQTAENIANESKEVQQNVQKTDSALTKDVSKKVLQADEIPEHIKQILKENKKSS